VAEEVVFEEKKIDLKKQNIDFYVKKAKLSKCFYETTVFY
jgi:hypothetical protein